MCADVPLRNYSLTLPPKMLFAPEIPLPLPPSKNVAGCMSAVSLLFYVLTGVQEDQKMAWLQHDAQPRQLSSLEKECQQKDALITQLYHQLGTIQQQQQQHGSDVTRIGYPTNDRSSDVAQKLMHLEKEVLSKGLEVDELRTKVDHCRCYLVLTSSVLYLLYYEP